MRTFRVKPLISGIEIVGAVILSILAQSFFYWTAAQSEFHNWVFFFIVFIGVLFSLCTCLALFGYVGLDVDIENHRWRPFTWLIFRKVGKFEDMPSELNYVMIFNPTFITRRRIAGDINDQTEYQFYEVSVVYEEGRKQVFLLCSGYRRAKKFAVELGEFFQLEIVDNTK